MHRTGTRQTEEEFRPTNSFSGPLLTPRKEKAALRPRIVGRPNQIENTAFQVLRRASRKLRSHQCGCFHTRYLPPHPQVPNLHTFLPFRPHTHTLQNEIVGQGKITAKVVHREMAFPNVNQLRKVFMRRRSLSSRPAVKLSCQQWWNGGPQSTGLKLESWAVNSTEYDLLKTVCVYDGQRRYHGKHQATRDSHDNCCPLQKFGEFSQWIFVVVSPFLFATVVAV